MGATTKSVRGATPPESASVASQPLPLSSEHSFTLQAVMELQKSTGQLTECVNSLRLSIEKQEERSDRMEERLSARIERLEEKLSSRIDRVEEKLSGVTHKLYAAGVVIAIVLTLGWFVANKAWDSLSQRLTLSVETSATKH